MRAEPTDGRAGAQAPRKHPAPKCMSQGHAAHRRASSMRLRPTIHVTSAVGSANLDQRANEVDLLISRNWAGAIAFRSRASSRRM
jgi:hypothetical protein